MPLFAFEGASPTVHETAFVAPTATLVGDVTVEEGASVWYGAVVRADYAAIVIRAGANVQDGAVIHAPPGMPCEIGPGATVAHNCVVHGATIGEEAMIANGAVVLDGAVVGARSLVAGGLDGAAGGRDRRRRARGRVSRAGEGRHRRDPVGVLGAGQPPGLP